MQNSLPIVYSSLLFMVFLFGLCIGSFLNVLIYRVPRNISFVFGRSCCTSCGNQIAAYDLIPLLSYLLLRGKCRRCGGAVSMRYPLIELMTGLLAMLVFVHYDFTFPSITVFFISSLFIAITFVDFDTMTIPNGFIIALIPFALISAFLFPEVGLITRLIGLLCVSLPMTILALVINGSFGGGDIKLMAVCGFMLGWQYTLVATFIAIMLAGVVSCYLLLSGKAKKGTHIPFGPALCLGCFISLLYGQKLLEWYFNINA